MLVKKRRLIPSWLTALLVLALTFNATYAIAKAELVNIRVGQKVDKTRVVFDIKQNHQYKITKLNNPSRVVVDFYKTDNQLDFKRKHYQDSRLYTITVKESPKRLRITLALHKNLDYRHFALAKNASGAERLVVDIASNSAQAKPVKVNKTSPKPPSKTAVKAESKVSKSVRPANVVSKKSTSQYTHSLIKQDSPALLKSDEFVVAIDPGHGGKDVGAVGPDRIYEKQATLQVSKVLQRLINQQPGMKAVLTRTKDVYIPLQKRVQIAKKNQADIFISVHADAFHDKSVRGGSVYVLSNRGASSVMARLLAKSENAALQDVSLKGRDDDVAFALSDMSRDANIRASKKLARQVLKEMQKTVKMHKHTVQSANFAVLKSIDMPSMLVETAFISNPSEARRLMNKDYQIKMASSIVRGLQKFVASNGQKPRWGESLYVHYRVKPGDTLSKIAANYKVTTKTLKQLNGLRDENHLRVGKKLRIPLNEQVVARLH